MDGQKRMCHILMDYVLDSSMCIRSSLDILTS